MAGQEFRNKIAKFLQKMSPHFSNFAIKSSRKLLIILENLFGKDFSKFPEMFFHRENFPFSLKFHENQKIS